MKPNLPTHILFQIDALRCRAIEMGKLVSVYREAETIRRGNPNDNVALEDIVEAIMAHCRDAPGFELNFCEAQGALMGSPITFH